MLAAFGLGAANPSSVHASGRAARRVVEDARAALGATIGSRPADLVFTSGGTEALNLAIRGATSALEGQCTLLVTAIEHEAVFRAASFADVDVQSVPVTPAGTVDLPALTLQLKDWSAAARGTPILCLMLANNETGVIQPVAEAASLVREAGGLVICDAVQALGKIAVNVALLGADYLALSAHKIGGPQGVGALWHRAGAPLKAIQFGGGQERGLRSGTENVAGIAGFAAAATAAVRDLARYASLRSARDAMEARLKVEGGVTIMGETAPRLAGTSNFARPGFLSETQVMALDLAGVCVSAGSACSSGKVKRSIVLMAMGADDALAESAIRTSLGWDSDPDDFGRIAEAWLSAAKRAALKEPV